MTVTGPAHGAGSLSAAIQAGLRGAGMASLSAGVQRLMEAYRSGAAPAAPVLATRRDAAAYAAYRMPATTAATAAAFSQLRLALPGWSPSSVLDFGAGTGGASWAITDLLGGPVRLTLLEQSAEAVRLGQAIFAESASAALRSAAWQAWQLTADKPSANADLAVAAYLLGELSPRQQERLVDVAMLAAPVVLLVEPGTPAGHRRIVAARARLLAAGYAVAAPCPHQLACPLEVPGDWCHFAARLQRSAVHRQAKGAELSYEDEKFSYVAAVAAQAGIPDRPAARVVRRPQLRKNLVLLDVCGGDGRYVTLPVGKSKGEAYRLARKVTWGGRWDDPARPG
ncbi:MAG TPA: small ribosomal subunit Rsm22 family protein [Streptosporangiaceae bacterium]|nr:small ribosomal subunit Rsm22 family protein [Streptosporangiaceae bacterium]